MTTAEPIATMPNLAPDTAENLVTLRAKLKGDIKDLEKILTGIEAKIIRFGPGEYHGQDGTKALVISPAPTVKMPTGKEGREASAQIKEIIGDDATFKKLFWFVGGYALCRDFRSVAAAVLTPARLQRVLALLETPSKPYLK